MIENQIEEILKSNILQVMPDNRVVLTPEYEESIKTILSLSEKLKSLRSDLDSKLMQEMSKFGTGKKIEGDSVTITRVDKLTYKLNIDIKEALQDKELRKLIVKKPSLDSKKVKELDRLPEEISTNITSYLLIKHE